MQNTIDFLDAVRHKHNIHSDNQLALFLGCTRGAISGYRNKRSAMDDEIALRVSDALEIDPAYVIACIHAEREKNAALRSIWERVATLTMGAAAVLGVVALLPLHNVSEWDGLNMAMIGSTAASSDLRSRIFDGIVYYVKYVQ